MHVVRPYGAVDLLANIDMGHDSYDDDVDEDDNDNEDDYHFGKTGVPMEAHAYLAGGPLHSICAGIFMYCQISNKSSLVQYQSW